MKTLVCDKSTIVKAIEQLREERQLIGPVRVEQETHCKPIARPEELLWDFDLSVNSIKDFFFPSRLALYELNRDGVRVHDEEVGRKRALLFVRPCDARSLTVLDRVFLTDGVDGAYASSRRNTLIVGISCSGPRPSCFCPSIGGSPFGTEGMDASLTALDDGLYLLDLLTERCEGFFTGLGRGLGSEAGSGEIKRYEILKMRAEKAVQRSIRVSPDMTDFFESEYWHDVSMACVTCGICTYLCPTCHCFDIVDEGFLRVRCWDTCSSAAFTKMASGENPRGDKFSRYRQRVYHKFSYYAARFGVHSCVGCGRCSERCPVGVDIVDIVSNAGM